MNDNGDRSRYLFDRRGPSDPEVVALERLLASRRLVLPRRRPPLLALASAAIVGFAVLAGRTGDDRVAAPTLPVRGALPASSAPVVSAPVATSGSIVEAAVPCAASLSPGSGAEGSIAIAMEDPATPDVPEVAAPPIGVVNESP